jgi:hypothetical protein
MKEAGDHEELTLKIDEPEKTEEEITQVVNYVYKETDKLVPEGVRNITIDELFNYKEVNNVLETGNIQLFNTTITIKSEQTKMYTQPTIQTYTKKLITNSDTNYNVKLVQMNHGFTDIMYMDEKGDILQLLLELFGFSELNIEYSNFSDFEKIDSAISDIYAQINNEIKDNQNKIILLEDEIKNISKEEELPMTSNKLIILNERLNDIKEEGQRLKVSLIKVKKNFMIIDTSINGIKSTYFINNFDDVEIIYLQGYYEKRRRDKEENTKKAENMATKDPKKQS